MPYFIRHADPTKKLYFAGLWDKSIATSEGKQGILAQIACSNYSRTIRLDAAPTHTFCIVTMPARPDMEWLHDRMPLIFSPTSSRDMEKLSFWLDAKNTWTSGIKKFLESYISESEPFTIYRGT